MNDESKIAARRVENASKAFKTLLRTKSNVMLTQSIIDNIVSIKCIKVLKT